MAEKHPYMSGSAGLVQVVAQLRKSFPPQVAADTLKKLDIAPNNETYVINTLRFVGVIDAEGKKNAHAASVFNKHDDAEFQAGFSKLIETAYSDLFSLHGENTWTLPTDKLISFFRSSDYTSSVVGQRQASTFQALASLSGKTDGSALRSTPKAKKAEKSVSRVTAPKSESKLSKATANPAATFGPANGNLPEAGVALTVRIEINLPANGDQETYDRIFKSIRENLLNAKHS